MIVSFYDLFVAELWIWLWAPGYPAHVVVGVLMRPQAAPYGLAHPQHRAVSMVRKAVVEVVPQVVFVVVRPGCRRHVVSVVPHLVAQCSSYPE